MEEDWLSKCVIDTCKRKVYLYSEGGDKKTVNCDTVQEFMNVLRFVRATASEDLISYVNPSFSVSSFTKASACCA